MSDYVLPVIGSSGIFDIADPFKNSVQTNERLFCRAIRSLADCVANNETPYDDIYKPVNLTEQDYNDDLNAGMYIVSFQNGDGRWLYIPAKYITKFPEVSGVPYVYKNLMINLPALPEGQDISFVKQALENLITDTLGVPSVVKIVVQSRAIMVTMDAHNNREAERATAINGKTTDRSRYLKLAQDFADLQARYQALEQHVMDNP